MVTSIYWTLLRKNPVSLMIDKSTETSQAEMQNGTTNPRTFRTVWKGVAYMYLEYQENK